MFLVERDTRPVQFPKRAKIVQGLFKLQTDFGKWFKRFLRQKPVGSEKIKMPSDTFVRRGSMLLSCRDASHCLSVNKLGEVKITWIRTISSICPVSPE